MSDLDEKLREILAEFTGSYETFGHLSDAIEKTIPQIKEVFTSDSLIEECSHKRLVPLNSLLSTVVTETGKFPEARRVICFDCGSKWEVWEDGTVKAAKKATRLNDV